MDGYKNASGLTAALVEMNVEGWHGGNHFRGPAVPATLWLASASRCIWLLQHVPFVRQEEFIQDMQRIFVCMLQIKVKKEDCGLYKWVPFSPTDVDVVCFCSWSFTHTVSTHVEDLSVQRLRRLYTFNRRLQTWAKGIWCTFQNQIVLLISVHPRNLALYHHWVYLQTDTG